MYITVDQNGRGPVGAVNGNPYAPLGAYGSRLQPGDLIEVQDCDETGRLIGTRRVVAVGITIHTADPVGGGGSTYVYVEIE